MGAMAEHQVNSAPLLQEQLQGTLGKRLCRRTSDGQGRRDASLSAR